MCMRKMALWTLSVKYVTVTVSFYTAPALTRPATMERLRKKTAPGCGAMQREQMWDNSHYAFTAARNTTAKPFPPLRQTVPQKHSHATQKTRPTNSAHPRVGAGRSGPQHW